MLKNRIVSPIILGKRIADLPRPEDRDAARRSYQIIEHRLKLLEIADSNEPDTLNKSRATEKGRDELSL